MLISSTVWVTITTYTTLWYPFVSSGIIITRIIIEALYNLVLTLLWRQLMLTVKFAVLNAETSMQSAFINYLFVTMLIVYYHLISLTWQFFFLNWMMKWAFVHYLLPRVHFASFSLVPSTVWFTQLLLHKFYCYVVINTYVIHHKNLIDDI